MEARIEIRPHRTISVTTYKHPTNPYTAFLIHGLGGRGAQWREQIHLLKQHYTVVVPDLFGHGNSDKPKPGAVNPYSFSEHEQDLRALFKQFSGEKNILLGHSYGGALSVGLAVEHQDQISQLVLFAPTPCTPNVSIPFIYQMPPMVMEVLRPWLEKVFQKSAFDKHDDARLLETEMIAGRNNPMYVIRAMIQGMKAMSRIDVTMLTIPTMIMLGETDNLILPAVSRQFYQAMPHHQFQTVAQASHMLMLEQPAKVNQLLQQFLAPQAMDSILTSGLTSAS
jgi:pimeloyl-ACP methyl ester carboxylesterase